MALPSVAAALPPEPIDEVVPSPVWHAPAVPMELADVLPAAALPPVPIVPAALQSWGCGGRKERKCGYADEGADLHGRLLFLRFHDGTGAVRALCDDGAVGPGDTGGRIAVDAA